jgi:hypothetical protein
MWRHCGERRHARRGFRSMVEGICEEAAFTAAWEAGRSLSLEQAVAEARGMAY